jgi:hypothetical protein
MDNPPFHKGHKRYRSTHIPEYFPSKKGKATHKRQSSSSSKRNTALPNNRGHFIGNVLKKSHIPSSAKQNVNHRNYHKIPNNKYLIPTSQPQKHTHPKSFKTPKMTSTKPGTINDVHGLLRKADDSFHFFETRLVKRISAREGT